MEASCVLQTVNLGKRYLVRASGRDGDATVRMRELWALRDINVRVERGEVLGVVGGNGAGKTTLLRVLARVTKPAEGRFQVRGRVGSLLAAGVGFHGEMTGRENVRLAGTLHGLRRREIETLLPRVLEFSGVGRFADTPIKRYSSGMYMRLGFAVAAFTRPDLLLLDEVLAVSDVAFRDQCLERVGAMAHDGGAVLFVSHDMASVRRVATRCVWLREGVVAAEGPTPEVVGAYLAGRPQQVMERRGADTSLPHIVELRLAARAGRVALAYRLPQPEPGLSLELVVATDLGVPLAMITTRAAGFVPPDEVGDHRAEVEVPDGWLVPGVYLLGARLRSSAGYVLDEVQHGLKWDVPADPSRIGRQGDAQGFELPATWTT